MLLALIEAAYDHFDGHTGTLGRALLPQVVATWHDGWTPEFLVPGYIVRSVDAVSYIDAAGAPQTLPASTYQTFTTHRGGAARVANGTTLPVPADRPDAVRIDLQVGYASASAVPRPIRQAILIKAGQLYAERGDGEGIAGADSAIASLIAPYVVRSWDA